jgi:hypothetical protein
MTLRRAAAALACTATVLVPSAASHDGVRVAWWLDEATAAKRLHPLVKRDYRPSAFEGFSARCNGLPPARKRAGKAVFKHFSCVGRLRLSRINYTFFYRVHVRGPRGRITVGG